MSNITVVVKICETVDKNIIKKITEATNTQTPIDFADQLSISEFNQFANQLFDNLGVCYITKRGQTFSNQNIDKFKPVIDHETIIKFWYATYFEQPDKSKSSLSKVLEQVYEAINNKNDLKYLFNKGINSPVLPQFINVYKIHKFVIDRRNEEKNNIKTVTINRKTVEIEEGEIKKVIEENINSREESYF